MPNAWLQQREISSRYKKGLHFIGDWHTHPEPIPNPSYSDLLSMYECFSQSKHTLNSFIMVIVGTDPGDNGVHLSIIQEKKCTQLFPDLPLN